MDISKYREDFPVLKNEDLIYLDSATSTLVPNCVIEAIRTFYETNGAAVKRGAYRLTIEATDQYEKARTQVAEFFNVAPSEIIFVPNEAYGISSLLYSYPWKKNNQIITSYLEHHSLYLPILYLSENCAVQIQHLSHSTDGEIDPDSLEPLIKPETKIIALTYSPLLFGTNSPVEPIVKVAHDHNVPVLVDGTRIAGHQPINLKKLGCDFFVCHGNIGLLGPMGVGVLYISQDVSVELNPLLLGSGTVAKVRVNDYQLMEVPSRFEPGNPNVADVVGLGTAVDYLQKIGLQNVRNHELNLINTMLNGLGAIENVEVYGPTDSAKKKRCN